ncbi:MAG: hypothetical protein ACJA2S_001305 [Cyclobacteriaceae bacterium]|jgi:hypothetical protein
MKTFFYIIVATTFISCSNNKEKQRDMEFLTLNSAGMEWESELILAWSDSLINYLSVQNTKIDNIRHFRQKMMSILQDIQNELTSNSGGLNEYGELLNPYEVEIPTNYMINQGNAEELKAQINFQIEGANTLGITAWGTFKDAKDIPVFANDPNQVDKTCAKLNFENRQLYQSIFIIEHLRLGLLIDERNFLTKTLLGEKKRQVTIDEKHRSDQQSEGVSDSRKSAE